MTTNERGGFDAWWESEGQFLDPDTADVPWFDKRKELAAYAYRAAIAEAMESEAVLGMKDALTTVITAWRTGDPRFLIGLKNAVGKFELYRAFLSENTEPTGEDQAKGKGE